MERGLCFIAVMAVATLFLILSPGRYNRHDLIKNSEVITIANIDHLNCSKQSCKNGNMTVETTRNTADISPVYVIKGNLNTKITTTIPVT